MLKLKVNDIEVEVEDGLTVLQACELAGAEIPEISFEIEPGTVSFLEISFVINLSTTESQHHNVRILTVNANKK